MYKSPGFFPFLLTSPFPINLIWLPLSMPAGIFTFNFFMLETTPAPLHSLHLFFIIFPSPSHLSQVLIEEKTPNTVLLVFLIWPAPSHSLQVSKLLFSALEPLQ